MTLATAEHLRHQIQLIDDLLKRLGAIRTDVGKLDDEYKHDVASGLDGAAQSLREARQLLTNHVEHPLRY